MIRCTNCTWVSEEDTGRPFGLAWLDGYCLGLLAARGYLVGKDMTGPSKEMRTLLTFQRNGHLVTYMARANYWQKFWRFRHIAPPIRAWLESLPDSELQPFKEHKRQEKE